MGDGDLCVCCRAWSLVRVRVFREGAVGVCGRARTLAERRGVAGAFMCVLAVALDMLRKREK